MCCVSYYFIRRERLISDLLSRQNSCRKTVYILLMCFYCCIYTHVCVWVPIHFLQAWAPRVRWLLSLSFSVVEESPTFYFSHSEERNEWLQLLYRWESQNRESSHLVLESQAEPWAWLSCKPAECWLLAYVFIISKTKTTKKKQTFSSSAGEQKLLFFFFNFW